MEGKTQPVDRGRTVRVDRQDMGGRIDSIAENHPTPFVPELAHMSQRIDPDIFGEAGDEIPDENRIEIFEIPPCHVVMIEDVEDPAVVVHFLEQIQSLTRAKSQRREMFIFIGQRYFPDGARIGEDMIVPAIPVGEIGQYIFGRKTGRVAKTKFFQHFGQVRVVEELSASEGFDFFDSGTEEEFLGDFDLAAHRRMTGKFEIPCTEGAIIGIALIAITYRKIEKCFGVQNGMVTDLKAVGLGIENIVDVFRGKKGDILVVGAVFDQDIVSGFEAEIVFHFPKHFNVDDRILKIDIVGHDHGGLFAMGGGMEGEALGECCFVYPFEKHDDKIGERFEVIDILFIGGVVFAEEIAQAQVKQGHADHNRFAPAVAVECDESGAIIIAGNGLGSC